MSGDATSCSSPTCAEVSPDLAELALGVLTGEERARALSHVERCEACARDLVRLGAVSDRLLAVHVEIEPPAGFADRALARLVASERPAAVLRSRGRRSRRALALAAVVVAAAASFSAAFVVARTTASGSGGARSAVAPARLPGVEVAGLRSGGVQVGEVYLHGGAHPWLLVSVDSLDTNASVTCEATGADGRRAVLGTFWLASGKGSWVAAVPASVGRVRAAVLEGARGEVLARARFGS